MKLILRIASVLLLPALLTGCARQPASEASKQNSGQAEMGGTLPFNQPKQEDGISPSSSLIPSSAEVPTATPLIVRLKSSISSATAHVGDSFEAVLDEPVVVQGKAIFPAATSVQGTVLAVNDSASAQAPAYLRLKATSIIWRGKTVPIESSSIFAKAGLPRTQQPSEDGIGKDFSRSSLTPNVPRVVRFVAGRRLTFRLTAPAVVPR